MCLNLIEIRSLVERGDIPVQIPKPSMDCWVSGANVANITFEEWYVDRVETSDRYKEADIHFCQVFS